MNIKLEIKEISSKQLLFLINWLDKKKLESYIQIPTKTIINNLTRKKIYEFINKSSSGKSIAEIKDFIKLSRQNVFLHLKKLETDSLIISINILDKNGNMLAGKPKLYYSKIHKTKKILLKSV